MVSGVLFGAGVLVLMEFSFPWIALVYGDQSSRRKGPRASPE
jgi:hypothetical protein